MRIFPVTTGAAYTTAKFSAGYLNNGFVVELNAQGSALIYGTFLPGMTPLALAIDAGDNAYAAGYSSTGFVATPEAFQTNNQNPQGLFSGAIVKLNAGGSAVIYATFLGGSGPSLDGDLINASAVDSAGNAAVAGRAVSADFPITPGAFQPSQPYSSSSFVSELNPSGSALISSTFRQRVSLISCRSRACGRTLGARLSALV